MTSLINTIIILFSSPWFININCAIKTTKILNIKIVIGFNPIISTGSLHEIRWYKLIPKELEKHFRKTNERFLKCRAGHGDNTNDTRVGFRKKCDLIHVLFENSFKNLVQMWEKIVAMELKYWWCWMTKHEPRIYKVVDEAIWVKWILVNSDDFFG